MSEIYYSSRTGLQTDNLLDKGFSIEANIDTDTNLYLDTLRIGNEVYKPKQDKINKYVYLHNVEVYIATVLGNDIPDGVVLNLKFLSAKSSPYLTGQEKSFFEEYGGVFIKNFPLVRSNGTLIKDGNFFYTGHPTSSLVKGLFCCHRSDTTLIDYHAYARINEDIISII